MSSMVAITGNFETGPAEVMTMTFVTVSHTVLMAVWC